MDEEGNPKESRLGCKIFSKIFTPRTLHFHLRQHGKLRPQVRETTNYRIVNSDPMRFSCSFGVTVKTRPPTPVVEAVTRPPLLSRMTFAAPKRTSDTAPVGKSLYANDIAGLP